MRHALTLGRICFLALLPCACAPKNPAPPAPVAEAYTLMDEGSNAKAVLILEDRIEKDPSDAEARFALATAYVGSAGVDVFSVYDSFQTLLFSRSLGDSFGNHASPDEASPPASEIPAQDEVPANSEAPAKDEGALESAIRTLDSYLDYARKLMLWLNHFPDVERSKVVYLERALALLDPSELLDPTRDLVLYRLFVRLLFLRETLVKGLIQNADVGSAHWFCSLSLQSALEEAVRNGKQLARIAEDLRLVYPDRDSDIERFASLASAFSRTLDELRLKAIGPVSAGEESVETLVKRAAGCSEIASGEPAP